MLIGSFINRKTYSSHSLNSSMLYIHGLTIITLSIIPYKNWGYESWSQFVHTGLNIFHYGCHFKHDNFHFTLCLRVKISVNLLLDYTN